MTSLDAIAACLTRLTEMTQVNMETNKRLEEAVIQQGLKQREQEQKLIMLESQRQVGFQIIELLSSSLFLTVPTFLLQL